MLFAMVTLQRSVHQTFSGTRYNKPSAFSLTVDEVDKRRKSMDYTDEDVRRFRQPYKSPLRVAPSTPSQDPSLSSISSTSSSSELSSGDFTSRVKSSPIQEEDEDQLFPLPSPRRSPSSSVSPSPAPSPRASPIPSPTASATCLSPFSHVSVSKDTLTPGFTSSQDGILKSSITKKLPQKPQQPRDVLLPPQTQQTPAFSLTLSIPNDFNPVFDCDPHGSPPTITNTTRKPRSHSPTLPPPPNTPGLSTPTSQTRTRLTPTRGRGAGASKPLPPVPSASLHSPAMPPTSTSLPTPSSSSSRSPPRSSLSPRLRSFPLLEALKGAGADVLKGVNSMGGANGIMGSA